MAMTIMSQSRCLRSNFIITNGKLAAADARRKCGSKLQNPNSNTQSKLKLQISNQSQFDPLGFGRLKFLWDLGFGILPSGFCCFPN
jgi:hypothetical protein